MIFSGVSCKERQELDVCEELTFTTEWRGRGFRSLGKHSTTKLPYHQIFEPTFKFAHDKEKKNNFWPTVKKSIAFNELN